MARSFQAAKNMDLRKMVDFFAGIRSREQSVVYTNFIRFYKKFETPGFGGFSTEGSMRCRGGASATTAMGAAQPLVIFVTAADRHSDVIAT
jgi:hypothetical protein